MAHIDVSKTGALINFSSGEAPFLEVQWPSKVCSVLLFPFAALWMLLQKLFQPAAAAWKCWASLFTQGAHNSNDEYHMSVADELNAKQFISCYSPESLPVWPWKMCLKAAERMPPKQPCTNRHCFIWIWTSTCRNKRHKCSYCSWNWIDIRLFFCMLMQGHTEIGCEFNVCTNKNWWAVTEESHGDFKCH